MQEEVENRTVNLAISTTKLTGRTNPNFTYTYGEEYANYTYCTN